MTVMTDHGQGWMIPGWLTENLDQFLYPPYGREWWSVRALITPPQMLQLRERHETRLDPDHAHAMPTLIGEAIGWFLPTMAHVPPGEPLTNVSHETPQGRIMGTIHYLTEDGDLWNFHLVSTWRWINGQYQDWEAELNVLRWLAMLNGRAARRLHACVYFTDWRPNRQRKYSRYPASPARVIEFPLWSDDKVSRWVEVRIKAHLAALDSSDEDLPSCTDDERWEINPQWAVTAPGRRRALFVGQTYTQAQEYIQVKAAAREADIEKRTGYYVRCQSGFCAAAPVCPQLRREGRAAL
jgi:hypothetical protein